MAPPPAAAMSRNRRFGAPESAGDVDVEHAFVNSSSDSSVIGLAISMPALLTRPSRPPNSATAAATAASTSALERTSHRSAIVPFPSSSAAARAPSSSTSAIATRAPPAVESARNRQPDAAPAAGDKRPAAGEIGQA